MNWAHGQAWNAQWPQGKKFGLLLSHDLDQIHDRELFRVLADVNHVRRMVTHGEKGHAGLAMRRIARSLIWPNRTGEDVRILLNIEARFGFRSSFYVLDDPYWSRHGPRYRLGSRGLARIVAMVRKAGGEIGIHGGVSRFNDAAGYAQSRDAVAHRFDVKVTGIRNHLLRFSYPDTWRAQAAAGFRYDSTFGAVDRPGVVGGHYLPFWPRDPETSDVIDITVLPVTVMDVTLFRKLGLAGSDALEAAWSAILPIIREGGLVTLLWHNNYFNEPEYADWQWVYEQVLDRCAQENPWCATGAEIDRWCREQRGAGEY